MKIAITGAQGVGKTTLANDIVQAMPKVTLLPEVARLALDLGFKLDKDADMETELWITGKQIELERTKGDWVADRCFIDLNCFLHRVFNSNREFDNLISLVGKIAKKQLSTYDLILYLPANEFPLENDGVRSTDKNFQNYMDQDIMAWLEYQNVPFETIIGTPKERLDKVLKLIKK